MTDRKVKWAKGLSQLSHSVNTNSGQELLWTVDISCKMRRSKIETRSHRRRIKLVDIFIVLFLSVYTYTNNAD